MVIYDHVYDYISYSKIAQRKHNILLFESYDGENMFGVII
jgi:hypothetical protein